MRLSKHVEEALYVLIILATQKSHQPVKSIKLSTLLQVSDSSLKKVLRQLVVKNLVKSAANKDGGFELKKDIRQITLFDIVDAIEGENVIAYSPNNLGETIFTHKVHVKKSEQFIIEGFNQARDSYTDTLKQIKIATILEEQSIQSGTIDWTTHNAKEHRNEFNS